jgi:hypothetical protein
MYQEMLDSNPTAVIKEIADQAQGVSEDGKPLEGGSRQQDLLNSGVSQKFIDAAIEAYPAPIQGVSVQMPGEVQKPQTTEIKPAEETSKPFPEQHPPISLKDVEVITSVNPTGTVFSNYTPEERMEAPLGENMVTLDKTIGGSPDDKIIIYRGGKSDKIVPGDYVTTNKQLAKDYAGTGVVVEMEVKKGDIIDDSTEPAGEEYIYRPKEQPQPAEMGQTEPDAAAAGMAAFVEVTRPELGFEELPTDILDNMDSKTMAVQGKRLEGLNKNLEKLKELFECIWS